MIGFIVGAVCLVALVKVARGPRWRRRWHHHGYYGAYAGDGGCFANGPGGWGPGRFVAGVIDDLRLTPDQEKVLRTSADALRHTARSAKDALRSARADLAKVLRADALDETLLAQATAKLGEASDTVKATSVATVADIHRTLDPSQRARLADLLESQSFCRFGRC